MPSAGSIRVLLAEDDYVHQQLLHRAMTHERPKVIVTVVGTGEAFLKAAEAQRFDCAVLDYNLPDYRADELLEEARKALGDCPALVISASHDQQVVISSIRCGGIDFVSKDEAVTGDVLWRRIEHAVEERRNHVRDRRRTERRHRQLIGLVQRDHLTGLFNRRYVERCLRHNWWRNDRRHGLACAMLDIDHFKQINDTWGHAAGDEVLRHVADAVRRHHAESGGATIRWGGEEMLIIYSCPTLTESWLDTEMLRAGIEQLRVPTAGQELQVTVSIGLVHGETTSFGHGVIDEADRALYLAKRLGRNAVCTGGTGGTEGMTGVAQAMEAIVRDGPDDVEERREEVLRRIRPGQGPTQVSHTVRHCEQVSRTAERLAQMAGIDEEEVNRIRIAGLFHDIGKCVIPEELLAQTEPLTPRQWWLMSRHTLYSQWIGQTLGLDARTLGHLRDHHRRFDDRRESGPPQGARVLCIADALVTMLTDQGYRQARAFDAALTELRQQCGRQFDPQLVEAAHGVEAPELLLAA